MDFRLRYDISKTKTNVRTETGASSSIVATTLISKVANWFIGSGQSLAYQAAYESGKPGTVSKIFTGFKSVGTSMANKTLTVTEAKVPQIHALIQKIQQGSSKANKTFIGPLKKAASSNHRTRQAIMFGLSQQEAFMSIVQAESDYIQEKLNKE